MKIETIVEVDRKWLRKQGFDIRDPKDRCGGRVLSILMFGYETDYDEANCVIAYKNFIRETNTGRVKTVIIYKESRNGKFRLHKVIDRDTIML